MWGVLVVMSAVVAVAIAPFVKAVVEKGVVRQGDGAPADDAAIVVSAMIILRFALIIRYGAIVPHSLLTQLLFAVGKESRATWWWSVFYVGL